jgi:hypothetical protein
MVLRPATFSQDGSHGGMHGLEGLRSNGRRLHRAATTVLGNS